jgi:hypothetical protein
MNSLPVATEDIHSSFTSPAPLMKLPNELFFEVASHLESFKDLNSLLRTNRFFHTLFNSHLYRLAVAAGKSVLEEIHRGLDGFKLPGFLSQTPAGQWPLRQAALATYPG